MKTSKWTISLCLLFLLSSTVVNAQKKWKQTVLDKALIYTPTDLKSGKTFAITAYYPTALNGIDPKAFLEEFAKKIQPSFGKSTGQWKITTEKNGSPSASIAYKNKAGKDMSNGYVLTKLGDDKYFVAQLISDADIGLLLKYAPRYKEVTDLAKAYFLKNNSMTAKTTSPIAERKSSTTRESSPSIKQNTSTIDENISLSRLDNMRASERRAYIKRAIRTQPGKGLSPSQVEKIWIHNRYSSTQGTVAVNVYLLLKDGTVHTDCEVPPYELNVAVSKRLQSKTPYSKYGKWSVWKKVGSGYQIKSLSSGEWKTLEGNVAFFARPGTKLNTTYISAGGTQSRGSFTYSITFYENGRFEMSSQTLRDNSALGSSGPYLGTVSKSDKDGTKGTTVVSGSSVGGGASTKRNDGNKNTGSYEIKKDHIVLKHDNGWVHNELFLFDDASKKRFAFGNKSYWISKRK